MRRARFFNRWPSSKGSSPETIPLASLSQTHFIAEILGGVAENELLENASRWYIIFLECKIRKAWRSLFIPVLRNAVSTPPSDEDLALAFQILQIIINRAKQENLALIELVDSLDNSHLLKSPDPDDEERAEANQLVLAAFGWITSLYSASDNPAPSKLELNIPRGSSGTELPERARSRISRTFHRRRSVAKETYITLSQTLQLYDQPLYTLLEAFGTVLPQRPQSWNLRSSHTVSEDTSLVRQPDHDKIEASFLCYHTLAKIAKVKIDWVDSLSLHLEFDMQAKVLKLFRLPSLCLLMCCASPLSCMFLEAIGPQHSSHNSNGLEDLASEYHREVLNSYRLIFGQDSSSASLFISLTKNLPSLADADPLLPILCGKQWQYCLEAKQISEYIALDEASPQYSVSADFPFLGQRLLDIQKHMKGHKLSSIWGSWIDNRDPTAWWNFWPLLVLGIVSFILLVVFGILQTVLAGMQIYYAKQQSTQQAR